MTSAKDAVFLFERTPLPVLVIDPADLRVIGANAAWRQSARCEAPIGKSLDEVAVELVDALPAIVEGGRVATVEDVSLGRDWYRVSLDPVRGDDGHRAYVIAAYSIRTQDVVDLRDAIQASAIRDQFIRTVAHDVRTPLAAQLMWLGIFMGPTYTEAQRAKAAEAIWRSAQEMSQIMADVADLTRLISGDLRLELSSVEIVPLLEELCATLALELCIEPDLGAVSASEPRLRSALSRMFSALVAGCPSGSRILVRARRDLQDIVIVVSGQQTPPPHGVGHQLHAGLFELMGGSMAVSTEPATGMTVTIRLRQVRDARISTDAGST